MGSPEESIGIRKWAPDWIFRKGQGSLAALGTKNSWAALKKSVAIRE
jgi:hypothetical protein